MAVVKSSMEWPCWQAAYPSAEAKCVFPVPTLPTKITFVFCATNPKRKRCCTCSWFIFFGQSQ